MNKKEKVQNERNKGMATETASKSDLEQGQNQVYKFKRPENHKN